MLACCVTTEGNGDNMNPAQIAMQNMYLVLKVAACLFVFRTGLDIFGYTRFARFLDMIALIGLAMFVITSLNGFMSAAESISKGVWPK